MNQNESNDVLRDLYDTVIERRDHPQEKSYTCYLLDTGLDKILKKVGETIIAAKNDSDSDLVGEISDLMYHLMVLMVKRGIPLEDVYAELAKRSLKSGNLKTFKQVDKNS